MTARRTPHVSLITYLSNLDMATQKTIEMRRDRILARALSFKVVSHDSGPSRADRRSKLQKLARELGLQYADCREYIKEEEKKYREAGIDPFLPDAHERLKAYQEGNEYSPPAKTV